MIDGTFDVNDLLIILSIAAGIGLVLSLLLLWLVLKRVRRINLPKDADPITALRMTPLLVVIVLDLLDFSLDFLSAPIAWALLNRLGLLPLRAAAAMVSLIPGTQVLPTMTVAWIIARLLPSRLQP